jgi:multiple sugar transport system substrate-binding protein
VEHVGPMATGTARAVAARLSRRQVLGGALATGAVFGLPALAGCGSSSSKPQAASSDAKADLILSSWQIPADIVAYTKLAADYTKTHPNVTIKVQETPGGDFNQWFTTQLAGGNAPDIILITWQQIGRYADNGGVITLDEYLPADYGADFQDQFWKAAQLDGKVHGIPQHTDTFATYYNKAILKEVGATVPTSLDQAWNLDQFKALLVEVKKATGKYGMVYGFGGPNTAYRWLPFLYMMGGKLLEDDNKTPAINNDAGVKAIDWFASLYREGLIPAANSIKGANDAATIKSFSSGDVGLMIYGDWIMTDVSKAIDPSKWDITYMPKDVTAASDLGGNLLAVSKSCKNPAVAADFITFVCNSANMKSFCETDLFLPVRKSLPADSLTFTKQSAQMGVFVEQAPTIPPAMASVETLPAFNPIQTVLADQLDLCFTGQQDATATAKNISDGIKDAVS